MSVVGIDIGNENCVIAAAKQSGIYVLLNDESKSETPAVVSFGEKQRFLGSAGAASATMNPKSTISQVKRLIGRKFNDVSVQEELRLLPFATSESSNGGILINLQYLNERGFTPVQILGMLFAHLKQMAEKNLESSVVDCVIGIPSYFTDFQRREYLDAAFIAGLRPLRLMHDCTAIALGYGMYKTEFSNSGPTNVVFIDIGHRDTQVTVAAFEQGKMTILSHSFDEHLGGRDFDEVLFKYFPTKFKEEYNIDVYSNTRASIRLRASCEKVKKVLSANAEAPLSIECLMDEKDVKGFITRQEFENLSSELLERVTIPYYKAVHDSGIGLNKIYSIELVGSGSRIPAIMKKLTSLFRKEPRRTLNASECVARGCALQCAMLSPTLRVREYEVQDSLPFSVMVPSDEGKNNPHPDYCFPKGSLFPSEKILICNRSNTFYLDAFCEMGFPVKIFPIGYFMIGPWQTFGAGKARVKVKVCININGIFQIEYAFISEDAYYSSNKAHLNPKKMGANNHVSNDAADPKFADSSPSSTYHADERRKGWFKWQNFEIEQNLALQDIKVEETKEKRNTRESYVYDARSKADERSKGWFWRPNIEVSENFLPPKKPDELRQGQEIEQNLALQDIKVKQTKEKRNTREFYVYDARSKADERRKGRSWTQYVEVSENHYPTTKGDKLTHFQEIEHNFALIDKKVEQTKEKRNTLEFYVYDSRSKILGSYRSFATDSEKDEISKSLHETEEWLYEEGDDETEEVYIGKHEYLRKLLDPIVKRYKDEKPRAQAINNLQACVAEYRWAADSLHRSQKEKLNEVCNRGEEFLKEVLQLELLPKNVDPKYWSNHINELKEDFESNCENIRAPNLQPRSTTTPP